MADSMNISRRGLLLTGAVAAGSIALSSPSEAFGTEVAAGSTDSDVALWFLYIDNKELTLNAEQNIVVALSGVEAVSSAQLKLGVGETGETLELEMTRSEGGSLLFTCVAEVAGTVSVDEICFTSEAGEEQSLSFLDVDASYRSFFVNSGVSTMSELDDADETTLNVYVPDGDGSLQEAESIESGVAAASAATVGTSRSLRAAVSGAGSDGVLTIALDPGHSEGSDSGAIGVSGAQEATLNWKIAEACRNELQKYSHVRVVMTRDRYEYKSIEERVISAVTDGADAVVSLHLNSSGVGAHGAEVYVPYDAQYNASTHAVGENLGNKILDQLAALGLTNRGTKIRIIDYDGSYNYPNGNNADYYGITRYARRAGIPGIIVEHAFIDSSQDYSGFLNNDSKLANLGVADAHGVANAYGLSVATEESLAAIYDYDYYTSNNPDVASTWPNDHSATLRHFLVYGMEEGRQGCAGFSPTYYKNAYADLREAYGSLKPSYYYHYLDYGNAEGRAGTGDAPDVDVLWRLYNPYSGQHLYTMSNEERNELVYYGWEFEGTAWHVPTSSQDGAVYRLYNPYNGDHHYTMNYDEYVNLSTIGWRQENIAWYSDTSGSGVPVYRLYNPFEEVGTHHYTLSSAERAQMIANGWRDEGECWNAIHTD